MESLGTTPSQTVGPFFSFSLLATPQSQLVPADTPDAVRIEGRVLDGEGAPVSDAMIEIWQAGRSGRYPHPADARADLTLDPGFTGFGRCGTDEEGRYSFVTVKPGPVPGPAGQCRRRISRSRCSRAGCCTGSSRGCTSRTRGELGRSRSWLDRRPRRAGNPGRRARRRGTALRHPSPGPRRDGVLLDLIAPLRVTAAFGRSLSRLRPAAALRDG